MKTLVVATLLGLAVHGSASAGDLSLLNGHMTPGYDVPYLHSSVAGYENADWMGALDDSTPIGDIAIPGTHNSMSRHGGDIPATQSLTIQSQLYMGIRYLDARFKYVNGELYAYHGPISRIRP